MARRIPLIVLLIALAGCLAASYGLRYGLMERADWLGICAEQGQRWECQVRSGLGLVIHFRVMAWAALGLALVSFFTAHRVGRGLAVLALLLGLPSLVLYTASLAVFAVVIAGLRLVREAR